jgi:hypothetical protein
MDTKTATPRTTGVRTVAGIPFRTDARADRATRAASAMIRFVPNPGWRQNVAQ